MITYPTTLDYSDFTTLLPVLTGDFSNPKHKVHALYDLEGFALGQLAADPTPGPVVMGAEDPDAYFKSVAEAHAAGKMQAGKLNWAAILAFVLKYLPLILPYLGPNPPTA